MSVKKDTRSGDTDEDADRLLHSYWNITGLKGSRRKLS